MGRLADGRIPLVDDHVELVAKEVDGVRERRHEIRFDLQRGQGLHELSGDGVYDVRHCALDAHSADNRRHVHIDNGVGVDMFLVRGVPCNGQVIEEGMRVARVVVVSAQHLRRKRLSEPAGTAHADELLGRAYHGVDERNQARLVHIRAISDLLEAVAARTQIVAHATSPLALRSRRLYHAAKK